MEFDFDDSFFDESKDTVETFDVSSITYVPNQRTNKWYLDTQFPDKSSHPDWHVIKYQADFFYLNAKYEKALELFKRRHTTLSFKSKALLRESCESIIQCYKRLDNWVDALPYADQMLLAPCNPADSSTHYVTFQVYLNVCKFDSAINCLEMALHVSCHYVCYWLDLHQLFKKIFNGEISSSTYTSVSIKCLYAMLLKANTILVDSQRGCEYKPMSQISDHTFNEVEKELCSTCFDILSQEGKNLIKNDVQNYTTRLNMVESKKDWLFGFINLFH